ncbi:MAG: glycosyltransferase family 2 protein [Patescibacteria group bacterium]|nr:glycosyltransferase family 2 protein [Patescibacteria group bacterium]
MDLSLIIVNYKSKLKLVNCLQSLVMADLSGIAYEIIVVENNSGDNLSDLSSVYNQVRYIKSPVNLGMGGGNNLGIKESSGRYILIANPDLVFSVEAIKILYQYLENNLDVAIVGPKLLNPDKSLQYSCARYPSIFLPLLRRTTIGNLFPVFLENYFMKRDSHTEIKVVDWLLGACLLVRKDDLLEGGKLFDDQFFMYFEDVDLCRRANKLGKKVVYNPQAVVIHDHMRDSARLPWYRAIFSDKIAREHLKSWWKYFKKWGWR